MSRWSSTTSTDGEKLSGLTYWPWRRKSAGVQPRGSNSTAQVIPGHPGTGKESLLESSPGGITAKPKLYLDTLVLVKKVCWSPVQGE